MFRQVAAQSKAEMTAALGQDVSDLLGTDFLYSLGSYRNLPSFKKVWSVLPILPSSDKSSYVSYVGLISAVFLGPFTWNARINFSFKYQGAQESTNFFVLIFLFTRKHPISFFL